MSIRGYVLRATGMDNQETTDRMEFERAQYTKNIAESYPGGHKELISRLARIRGRYNGDYIGVHVFKEIFPYFMSSRFANKAKEYVRPENMPILSDFPSKKFDEDWRNRILLWNMEDRGKEDLEPFFEVRGFEAPIEAFQEREGLNHFAVGRT